MAIEEMIREKILENGDRVLVSTPYCKLHKKTHSNCVGCEAELGCQKLVRIKLLHLDVLQFEYKNPFEKMRAMEKAAIMTNKIIQAKTSNEVDEILS